MFRLVQIRDSVRIAPHRFNEERIHVLEDEVNQKFANRVIEGEGLCILLWDWVSIGEDRILYDDGAAHAMLEFRMVMFRPEEGDVVLARVKAIDKNGLYLSLDFFDDIFVSKDDLQDPSTYDEAENAWIWTYEGTELYIYDFEYVWFKVLDVKFTSPGDREAAEGSKSPMHIRGTISGDGLGSVTWWM